MGRSRVVDNVSVINNEYMCYVEPNASYAIKGPAGKNGIQNRYEFTTPLEDLSIFVALKIDARNHTMGGKTGSDANGNSMVMTWSSSENGDVVNLHHGTTLYTNKAKTSSVESFTTNWAEANYADIIKGSSTGNGATQSTSEMFGIKSINVSYQANMVPIVKMEFTDIRGMSLFSPEELRHHLSMHDDKTDIYGVADSNLSGSFFKSFFSQPYPRFTLFLKGYYGQPVSYDLMCQDFNARFSPQNGNFEATATFIGYSYAFLTDVVMNALMAVPYSDFLGAKYWEQRKSSGDFTVTNQAGEKVPMPTLIEIIDTVQKLREDENNKRALSTDSLEYLTITESQNESEALEILVQLYDRYRNVAEAIYNKTNIGADFDNNLGSTALMGGQSMLLLTKERPETLNSFITTNTTTQYFNKLTDEIKAYNERFGGNIKTIQDIGSVNAVQILALTGKTTKKYKIANKDLDKELKNDTQLKTQLLNLIEKNNKYATSKKGLNNNLENYTYAYILYGYDFILSISKRQAEIAKKDKEAEVKAKKELDKKEAELKKTQLEKIAKDVYKSDAVGFYPTVENLMRIVFAHLETLVYCIMSVSQNIENEQPHRTVKSLEASLEDFSDLPKGTYINDDTQIPPFPRVVKTKPGSEITAPIIEDDWIGNMPGHYLETDLINGIVNGVLQVSKMTEVPATQKKKVEQKEKPENLTVMQIPLTPLDFKLTDIPYGNVMDFKSDFAGRVVMRMMEVLDMPQFNNDPKEGWQSLAETLGKAEAVNFASFFPNPNSTFLQKLSGKTFNADTIVKMVMNNKDKKIQEERSDKQWAWDFPRESNNRQLLRLDGEKYVYDAYKTEDGCLMYPVQGETYKDINQNTSEGLVAPTSDHYITVSDRINQNSDAFLTIDENIAKYRNIRDKGMMFDGKKIDSIVRYYEKLNYNKDRFKKYFTNNQRIINKKFRVCAVEDGITEFNTESRRATRFLPTIKRDGETLRSLIANKQSVFAYDNTLAVPYGEGNTEFEKLSYNINEEQNKVYTYTPQNRFTPIEDILDNELSAIRNYEISSFNGLAGNKEVVTTASIFGQEGYYLQDNDKLKAYLFLRSLNCFNLDKDTVSTLMFGTSMDLVPKALLLQLGAILWKQFSVNGDNSLIISDLIEWDQNTKETEIVSLFYSTVRRDIINTLINYFTKWVDSDFRRLIQPFELKFINTNGASAFFSMILDPQNYKKEVGQPILFDDNLEVSKLQYSSVEALLSDWVSEEFFLNYLSVAPNVDTVHRGIKLINRDTIHMDILMEELFKPELFMFNTRYVYTDLRDNQTNRTVEGIATPLSVPKTVATKYLNAFLKQLKEEYKHKDEIVQRTKLKTQIKQASDNTVSDDIKISIYKYVKALYDKWLMTDNFTNWTVQHLFEGEDKYFHFVDTYYNYSGHLTMNIGKFADALIACQTNKDVSLLTFLSSMLSDGNFLILYIQNFIDLSDYDAMTTMFKPIAYTNMNIPNNHPDFIIMYRNTPSSNLDAYGQKADDSFLLNTDDETSLPISLTSKTKAVGNRIPAFGVSYGKQHQDYFTDISIDSSNAMTTEQSIKALFTIAGAHSEKSGEAGVNYWPVGQDLFTIFQNNSYTCDVSMLGCAWVQPMMYFTLLNIPMWRGTYMIYNVEHNISPGKFETKFTGNRMPKVSNPQREEYIEHLTNNFTNVMTIANGNITTNVTTPCGYNVFPIATENRARFTVEDLNKAWNPEYSVLDAISLYVYSMIDTTKDSAIDTLEVQLLSTLVYNRTIEQGDNIIQALASEDILANIPSDVKPEILNKIKPIVLNVFMVSPTALIGESTLVKTPCNIMRATADKSSGTTTGSKSRTLKITSEHIKKLYYAVPAKDYSVPQSGITAQQCGYLLHHNNKVYTTNYYQTLWWADDFNTDTKNFVYDLDSPTDISITAWNFCTAIQNSVKSAGIEAKIHVLRDNSGGNTLHLTLDMPEEVISNKAILFDIILNGYYNYIEKLVWILNVSDSPTEFPKELLVTVKEGANNKAIYMANTAQGNPLNLSSLNMDINASFLGILGSKYLNIDNSITQKECKNFSRADMSFLSEMFSNNEACIEPLEVKIDKQLTTTDTASQISPFQPEVSSDKLVGDWNVTVALKYIEAHGDDALSSSQNIAMGIIAGMLGSLKIDESKMQPIFNAHLRGLNPSTIENDNIMCEALENLGWEQREFDEGLTPSMHYCASNYQLGDVGIFKCNRKHSIGNSSCVAIWTGQKWIDLNGPTNRTQMQLNPFGSECAEGKWTVYRYTGEGMNKLIQSN